jgi:four helix bundle protein
MIERVQELQVYQRAFAVAMRIFEHSKSWPKEEQYALTDQVRRSSRSVCANLAEAWAKRLYPKHFVAKLSDAHGEATETTTWLTFAAQCGYLDAETTEELQADYRRVIGGLVRMTQQTEQWCGPSSSIREEPGSYDLN